MNSLRRCLAEHLLSQRVDFFRDHRRRFCDWSAQQHAAG
jgi:hypothetical protein